MWILIEKNSKTLAPGTSGKYFNYFGFGLISSAVKTEIKSTIPSDCEENALETKS